MKSLDELKEDAIISTKNNIDYEISKIEETTKIYNNNRCSIYKYIEEKMVESIKNKEKCILISDKVIIERLNSITRSRFSTYSERDQIFKLFCQDISKNYKLISVYRPFGIDKKIYIMLTSSKVSYFFMFLHAKKITIIFMILLFIALNIFLLSGM